MLVLAISAHPDDETLGCGGTLLKHQVAGSRLSWLIVTAPKEPEWSAGVVQQKRIEVQKVAKTYGVENCFKLGFPAAQLDTIPRNDLIQGIRKVISDVRPELIYVVHGGDVHTDHNAVFAASMSVLKPFYMAQLGVRRVLCYEVLSSTEAAPPGSDRMFMPNVFSDITPHIGRKIDIMNLYKTECQAEPLPRGPSAIRALARYRGATIGVEYAEAFMLVRELA